MTNAPRELHPVPSEGTLDIREFMSKVGRHKWLILLVAASVTLLVAIYSYSRPSVYESTAQFLVRPTLVQPLQSNPFDTVSMPTEMQLVKSAQVAEIARQTIGGTLQDALDGVSVTNPANTQILDISYSAHDPQAAQAGAQAFAQAYQTYKHDQAAGTIKTYSDTIQAQISELDGEIADLNTQIAESTDPAQQQSWIEQRNSLDTSRLTSQNQLATVATLSTDPGQVVEGALRPTSPVSPKHKLDLALGLLLGLIRRCGPRVAPRPGTGPHPSSAPRRQVPRCSDPGLHPTHAPAPRRNRPPRVGGRTAWSGRRGISDAEDQPPRGLSGIEGEDDPHHERPARRGEDEHGRQPCRRAGAGREVGGARSPPIFGTRGSTPCSGSATSRASARCWKERSRSTRRWSKRICPNCASCPAGRSTRSTSPSSSCSPIEWARCSRSAADRISLSSMVRPSSRSRTVSSSLTSSTASSS